MNFKYFFGKFIHYILYQVHLLEEFYLSSNYKSKFKSCGKGVIIGKSIIFYLENIEVGDNVIIGEGARIVADGGLKIDDNTHIARNLIINTSNHNYKGACLPYDDTNIKKPVIIGKNVWIGINVIIVPGTIIEDGCIIGSGSVVYGKVKKYSIVGNNSLSVIKKRDIAHYERIEKLKIYGGENGKVI